MVRVGGLLADPECDQGGDGPHDVDGAFERVRVERHAASRAVGAELEAENDDRDGQRAPGRFEQFTHVSEGSSWLASPSRRAASGEQAGRSYLVAEGAAFIGGWVKVGGLPEPAERADPSSHFLLLLFEKQGANRREQRPAPPAGGSCRTVSMQP